MIRAPSMHWTLRTSLLAPRSTFGSCLLTSRKPMRVPRESVPVEMVWSYSIMRVDVTKPSGLSR